MQNFETVDLRNKSGYLAIACPTIETSRLIRFHHLKLLKELEKMPKWPPRRASDDGQTTLDVAIYDGYRSYFAKIARLLKSDEYPIGYDWTEELDPVSRHEFFIATDLVEHWEDENTKIPGLPKLMTLMGDSLPKKGVEFKPPECTSGDADADTLAQLLLVFEGTSPVDWTHNYSTRFAAKVLEQAASLRKKAQEEMEKEREGKNQKEMPSWNPTQERPPNPDFELCKDRVLAQLNALNIETPEEF